MRSTIDDPYRTTCRAVTMQIKAIDPKHQSALEALYQADREHVALVISLALAADQAEPDSREHDRAQQRKWYGSWESYNAKRERFIERPELPKRELDAFARAYAQHHGYTPYLTA